MGDVKAEVVRAALEPWHPETVVAVGPGETVPLLAGKGMVDGRTAVYVCEHFACQTPVTESGSLPNFLARPLS